MRNAWTKGALQEIFFDMRNIPKFFYKNRNFNYMHIVCPATLKLKKKTLRVGKKKLLLTVILKSILVFFKSSKWKMGRQMKIYFERWILHLSKSLRVALRSFCTTWGAPSLCVDWGTNKGWSPKFRVITKLNETFHVHSKFLSCNSCFYLFKLVYHIQ